MQAIVGAALQQRVLVLILSVALMVGGLFAYKQLNIEAYPDPVPPLVEIVTQNPGQSSEEIERYVAHEQPFDCAGGFKVEALGVALFECIESQDPTALIGLPLIWLAGALRAAGYLVP